MNKKLLEDAQQVVAAGLLGQGIKVVYDTDTPYADLKNRVMHLRPLPEEVDANTTLHLRADCDHEMGHFLCSDPGGLDRLKDPMLKVLANAIEDGFVERIVSRRWFGCGENLRASNDELMGDLVAVDSDHEDHLRRLALTALQLLTFGESRADVEKRLGPLLIEDLNAIEDLIPELAACASTDDGVRLAQEVDRRWWWTDPERPRGGAENEGEENKAGDDNEEKGDDGRGEDEEESHGGGTQGDKGEGEQRPDKESRGGGGDDSQATDSREELAERLSQGTLSAARKKRISEARFKRSRYWARTASDVESEIQPFDHPPMVTEFVESVRSVVPTLRRRLLMEFRGVGTRREFDCKAGVIDRESLHKVAIGNPRIFTRDTPFQVPDADATLLVDMSGSMACYGGRGGRTRLYIASQAAYAFSTVLDLIGVSNEVLGFTTTSGWDSRWMTRGYTRVRPLHKLIIKPAGTNARVRKAHFASMATHTDCAENVDGECVMWAAKRLAARNRKGMAPILIVLSDGEPASTPEDHRLLSWHLKRSIERIEKAGINVIGVGIQTSSVRRYYKHHLVINDVSDLVGTSYGILRTVLRKAKRVG